MVKKDVSERLGLSRMEEMAVMVAHQSEWIVEQMRVLEVRNNWELVAHFLPAAHSHSLMLCFHQTVDVIFL